MSFMVVAPNPFATKSRPAASSTAARVRSACSCRKGDRYFRGVSLATAILSPIQRYCIKLSRGANMREGDLRSVSRVIAADPATVYRLVSDVTRTGEWSPETRSARWIGGAAGPAAGARFRGVNRWRLVIWTRTCVVEEAEPGKRFVFRTLPKPGVSDSTRWSYEFEDVPGGTRVTESYEILQALPAWLQSTVIAALL